MAAVTYYYNAYSIYGAWTNESNAADGSTATFATATISTGDYLTLIQTTCDGTDLGVLTKIEIRCYGYNPSGAYVGLELGSGSDYFDNGEVAGWSSYIDITSWDTWTWTKVKTNTCLLYPNISSGTLGVAKVELKVTYTEAAAPAAVPRHGFILYQDPGMA